MQIPKRDLLLLVSSITKLKTGVQAFVNLASVAKVIVYF